MDNDKRADIIVRSAARLPYQERAEVARRILEERPEARPTAEERYAELLPVAESVIGKRMDQSRGIYDVMIRRFVAFRLRSEGYAYTDIAAAMGRHHSTVIHYVRTMQDCFDEPIFYASDLNLYMCFAEGAGHVE